LFRDGIPIRVLSLTFTGDADIWEGSTWVMCAALSGGVGGHTQRGSGRGRVEKPGQHLEDYYPIIIQTREDDQIEEIVGEMEKVLQCFFFPAVGHKINLLGHDHHLLKIKS
jgi:hypothetical protein